MPAVELPAATDRIICQCLQVRESQVAECIDTYGLASVPEVKGHCGAGGGCNACHRRIRQLIQARQSGPAGS
ncbi:MAG: bacterioferritin-associated ferredoxin [Planctomycetaceae bacterium]